MMNDEPPIVSVKPNAFWRENAEGCGQVHINIESAARELILVNSLLEGLYFHAITFSDLKPVLTYATAAIYLAHIALWLLSLIFTVLTLALRNLILKISWLAQWLMVWNVKRHSICHTMICQNTTTLPIHQTALKYEMTVSDGGSLELKTPQGNAARSFRCA